MATLNDICEDETDLYSHWDKAVLDVSDRHVSSLYIGSYIKIDGRIFIVRDGFTAENSSGQFAKLMYNSETKKWLCTGIS